MAPPHTLRLLTRTPLRAALPSMSPSLSTTAAKAYTPVLAPHGGISDSVERMEYAVRGGLVLRAEQLSTLLATPAHGLPFSRVTYCNIGNPQSVGQAPITFVRQVLASVICPDFLLGSAAARARLPADVVARADAFLAASHGVGAYTESKGIPAIRASVARALQRRDGGAPVDVGNLFLTNGASEGVKTMLAMLVRKPSDGVMIPVPQYPLYSATMQGLNGTMVGYHLDEANDWGLDEAELEARLAQATNDGVTVRALCVINPGNPTGQALSAKNVATVVRFCEKHNLVIMADEVYQSNCYSAAKPFVSFKKVVQDLGSPVELASFHSISKGFFGECGIRGGFMELYNFHEYAVASAYKQLSVSLCSNIPGQVVVEIMMNPPVEGDPSYELFEKETGDTFDALSRKSAKLAAALNTFEGVTCTEPQGAMYLFPKIELPEKAVRAAKERGLGEKADSMYCMELLDATGICVVPGSGFGQSPGTWHFRTTFLPPEAQVDDVVVKMRVFHEEFMKKYS